MTFTTNPLRCPNADCRAQLTDYNSILTYTRASGVTILGCGACGVAFAAWPHEIEEIKNAVDRLRR